MGGFRLTLVTNYILNPGGENYGWYGGGGMGLIIDSVVTTPVPEPQTYALGLVGLGVVGLATSRRKRAGV